MASNRLHRHWSGVAFGGVVLLWIGHCQHSDSPAKPSNVLLISIDTTRADALGCYGSEHNASPFLDELANSGVLFESAFSPVPMTLPSHTTMLTGLDPSRHQVHDNTVFHVPEEAETLAEILKTHGYRTLAAVASLVLAERYNLGQGFDDYDDTGLDSEDPTVEQERPAAEIAETVLAQLPGSEPWFAFVHFYDPHQPYNPPPDLAQRFGAEIKNLYYAEIAAADRAIQQIVNWTREHCESDTLIVVTSDHGEGRGEHYEITHGHLLHDATQHVPLLMQHPRLPPQRIATLVTLADLTPTILDWVGLEVPPLLDGASLVPLVRGEEFHRDPVAYLESMATLLSYDLAPLYGIRTPDWKLVQGAKSHLFDLRRDPKENRNIASQHPDIVQRLQQRLAALRDERGPKLQETRRQLTDQEREALGALGYIDGNPANLANRYDERPDPYDHARDLMLYNDTKILMQQGNLAGAISGYKQLNQTLPNVFLFRQNLAICYEIAGRPRDAHREYLVANQIRPQLALIEEGLGVTAYQMGELNDAKPWLERAAAHSECAPRVLFALWDVYHRAGQDDTAEQVRTRLLGLELDDQARAKALALPQ